MSRSNFNILWFMVVPIVLLLLSISIIGYKIFFGCVFIIIALNIIAHGKHIVFEHIRNKRKPLRNVYNEAEKDESQDSV